MGLIMAIYSYVCMLHVLKILAYTVPAESLINETTASCTILIRPLNEFIKALIGKLF